MFQDILFYYPPFLLESKEVHRQLGAAAQRHSESYLDDSNNALASLLHFVRFPLSVQAAYSSSVVSLTRL